MPLRVGIIGAGIAGLTLGLKLLESGHLPSIFDKGRGVGGRTATRRGEGVAFDHGAQYFTVRTPVFQAFLDQYVPTDHRAVWEGRFASLKDGQVVMDPVGDSKWVGVPGMNAVAQDLARPLDVRTGVTITRLERSTEGWTLRVDPDQSFGPFDWVVSTAPPAQSSALLEGWSAIAEKVRSVAVRPCFALMVEPSSPLTLPADGIRCDHPSLGWVADNRSKPGRGPSPALVIQSNHDWAETHADDDRAAIARTLLDDFHQAFGLDLGPLKSESLHRWLYAKPVEPIAQACLVDRSSRLAVCGDWCLAAKVEGAFRSGVACAEDLIAGID